MRTVDCVFRSRVNNQRPQASGRGRERFALFGRPVDGAEPRRPHLFN